MIAYQGRRHPVTGDLVPYEVEEMIAYIDKVLRKIGLDFHTWSRQGYLAEGIIDELKEPYRRKVWLTTSKETAASYATRSPELAWYALMDAIDNIFWKRRWRQSNTLRLCRERNRWIQNLLEGEPIVVSINVDDCGHNTPFDRIAASKIISIEKCSVPR